MNKLKIILTLIIIFLFAANIHSEIKKSNDKLTMELEDVELTLVLNMIAKQYDLNLVLSSKIEGNISIRLHDVELESALNAILTPNEYNYYIKDKIIIVKPISATSIDEIETEIITLKYAEPVTIKKALDAIKSEKGSIVIMDKSSAELTGDISSLEYSPNSVFISEIPSIMNRMKEVISQIDIPERLISITVKIVETKIDNLTKLGLTWPATITTSLGGTATTGTNTDNSSSNGNSNFALSKDLNQGGWSWGTLSVNQLTAVLNMLEQNGNTKLLSDPHISTLENHTAEIKIQTVIPIPTINRFTEAASTQDILTFYDEEVGISLKVTPRINENGKITMDVEPKIEDIIGFSGPPESQKPITISRSIKTKITVQDGETVALGGLLKDDIIKEEQKVPILGSIPILGRLFRSTSEEKSKTDLLILITPKIMPQ